MLFIESLILEIPEALLFHWDKMCVLICKTFNSETLEIRRHDTELRIEQLCKTRINVF